MIRRLLFLMALACIPPIAPAQSPFNASDPVIGTYHGVITVGGMPQPIWLEITSTTPGAERAAKITYSQPRDRACDGWQYGGPAADGHVYYWNKGTGSYAQGCLIDKNRAPILVVRLTDSGGLRYELRADKSTVLESHVLMPE